MLLLSFGVFLCGLLLDFTYARWIQSLHQRRLFAAPFWSISCGLIAGFMTIEIVSDPWLLIVACMGHGLGSWLAIKLSFTEELH